MKISKLEGIVLLLVAIALSFSFGWFLRGEGNAAPVRIETQHSLSEAERIVALPAPTQTPVSTTPPEATPAPTPPEIQPGEVIDINTADSQTLQRLPGIGEKRALDIIAYRQANGPFYLPEDLTNVKGIGEGILEDIIAYITTESIQLPGKE